MSNATPPAPPFSARPSYLGDGVYLTDEPGQAVLPTELRAQIMRGYL